jgi:hypothetical protein
VTNPPGDELDFEATLRLNAAGFLAALRSALAEARALAEKSGAVSFAEYEKLFGLIQQKAKETGRSFRQLMLEENGLVRLLALEADEVKALDTYLAGMSRVEAERARQAKADAGAIKEELSESVRALRELNEQWRIAATRFSTPIASLKEQRTILQELKNLQTGLYARFDPERGLLRGEGDIASTFGQQLRRIQYLTGIRQGGPFDEKALFRINKALEAQVRFVQDTIAGYEEIQKQAASLNVETILAREDPALMLERVRILETEKAALRAQISTVEQGTKEWEKYNKALATADQQIKALTSASRSAARQQAGLLSVPEVSISPSLAGSRDPRRYFQEALRQLAGALGLGDVGAILSPETREGFTDAAANYGNELGEIVEQHFVQLGAKSQEVVRRTLAGVLVSGRLDLLGDPKIFGIESAANEVIVDVKAINDATREYLERFSKGLIKIHQLLQRDEAAQYAAEIITQLSIYSKLLNKPSYAMLYPPYGATHPESGRQLTTPEVAARGPAAIIPISIGGENDVTFSELAELLQGARSLLTNTMRSPAAISAIGNLQQAELARRSREQEAIAAAKAADATQAEAKAVAQLPTPLNQAADAQEEIAKAAGGGTGGGAGTPPSAPPGAAEPPPLGGGGPSGGAAAERSLREQLIAAKELLAVSQLTESSARARVLAQEALVASLRKEREDLTKALGKGEPVEDKLTRVREQLRVAQVELKSRQASLDMTQNQTKGEQALVKELESRLKLGTQLAALMARRGVTEKQEDIDKRIASLREEAATVEKGSQQHKDLIARIRELRNEAKQMVLEREKDAKAAKQQAAADEAAAKAAEKAYQTKLAMAARAQVTYEKDKAFGVQKGITGDQVEALDRETQAAATNAAEKRIAAEASKALSEEMSIQSQQAKQSASSVNLLSREVGNAGKESTGWAQRLFSLQKVATVFFGAFLASVAYGALNKVSQAFAQAGQYAKDLELNLVKLDLAVRASQRYFGESAGSVEEYRNLLKELHEAYRGFFTDSELASGMATLIGQTRELHLTAEQTQELAKAAAVLAATNPGKTFEQAAEAIGRFAAGPQRALFDFGVQVTDIVRNAEAFKLFGKNNYDALSKAQKVQVDYNIILRETAVRAEDVAEVIGTIAGESTRATNIAKENLTATGRAFELFKLGFLVTLAVLSGAWKVMWETAVTEVSRQVAVIMGNLAGLKVFIDTGDFEAANQEMANVSEMAAERIKNGLLGISQGMGNVGAASRGMATEVTEAFAQMETAANEFNKIASNLSEGLAQENLDYLQNRRDAWVKSLNDESDAQEKFGEDLANAIKKYNSDIKDIDERATSGGVDRAKQAAEQKAKAYEDYLKAVARAEEDYQNRRADIIRDAARREEEAELEHRRRLQHIVEDALVRIQDAVRAQDARAVLLAVRDRNIAINRENEKYEDDKAQRARQVADRLADLDAQYAQEKLRREQDYKDRLKEIDEQAAKERASGGSNAKKAKEKRAEQLKEELDQIRENHGKETDARKEAYEDQRRLDAGRHISRMLRLKWEANQEVKEWANRWGAVDGVTEEWMNTLETTIAEKWGKDGDVIRLFETATDYIKQLLGQIGVTYSAGVPTWNAPQMGPFSDSKNQIPDCSKLGPNCQPRERDGQWTCYCPPTTTPTPTPTPTTGCAGTPPTTPCPDGGSYVCSNGRWVCPAALPFAPVSGSEVATTIYNSSRSFLEVKVTADEHFSQDFEENVINAIADTIEGLGQ